MTAEILEGGRRIDENGLIMPWYTSPCLGWLETLDLHDKDVFEFGVGDSTRWWKSKCRLVNGVDSSEEWAKKADAQFQDEKKEYILAIDPFDMYDIIIIDGIWRDDCTEHALKQLKSGGFLILDNWLQHEVEPEWPLTQKLIEGMPVTIYKEPEHKFWKTAVIQKP